MESDEQGLPTTVILDHAELVSLSADDGGPQHKHITQGNKRKGIDAILEVWRIDDEWWRNPISRRYVEVVLEGGGHSVLYEDLMTGEWFMQMP